MYFVVLKFDTRESNVSISKIAILTRNNNLKLLFYKISFRVTMINHLFNVKPKKNFPDLLLLLHLPFPVHPYQLNEIQA